MKAAVVAIVAAAAMIVSSASATNRTCSVYANDTSFLSGTVVFVYSGSLGGQCSGVAKDLNASPSDGLLWLAAPSVVFNGGRPPMICVATYPRGSFNRWRVYDLTVDGYGTNMCRWLASHDWRVRT